MPRRVRELENNGIYHVYARGNNRQKIFRDREDFEAYLEILSRVKERYEFEIYHYCLMTNHFHFLMRVQLGAELPRIMHQIQLRYVKYYKKKYRYYGHLFQGRFRSPRIAEESHYLQCGRYIERNPLKARMTKKAWEYEYSSAAYYVLGKEDKLMTPNLYYEDMGKTPTERQTAYKKFVSIDEPYAAMIDEYLRRV